MERKKVSKKKRKKQRNKETKKVNKLERNRSRIRIKMAVSQFKSNAQFACFLTIHLLTYRQTNDTYQGDKKITSCKDNKKQIITKNKLSQIEKSMRRSQQC